MEWLRYFQAPELSCFQSEQSDTVLLIDKSDVTVSSADNYCSQTGVAALLRSKTKNAPRRSSRRSSSTMEFTTVLLPDHATS